MEEFVRYSDATGVHIGLRVGDDIRSLPGVESMAHLLRLTPEELRTTAQTAGPVVTGVLGLLAPIDELTEVWGSGVTYERSREARVEESGSADVYDLVYAADRPELFFKAPSWRVRTDGESIAIRSDSALNVPEPELAVWVGAGGDILGYLVCDDMTSRSIEAANPLYLPQAKVYTASCSVSSAIVPFWNVPDAMDLNVTMKIRRGDAVVWSGEASTASIVRSMEELVACLYAETDFPDGVILSTGTGIVPEVAFVLEVGDVVDISIEGIGTLVNDVAPSLSARGSSSITAPAAAAVTAIA